MLPQSAEIFIGACVACLTAAVCWGGVAWAAWRWAGRWFPREGIAARWCATSIIVASFIVLVTLILGSVGLLSRMPATIASAAFCAAASRLRGGVRPVDEARSAHAWLQDRLREGYGVPAMITALLVVQALLRGLRCPPLSWDSLTYHAFLPARWVQFGKLAPFYADGGMECARAFPINLELLVAWMMLPFRSDLCVNLVNFPVILWLAATAYGLARELKVAARFAVWAPMLLCFSPSLWHVVTTQYSDLLVAAALLSGVLFFARYIRTNRRADIGLSAAAFGLAVGAKHTALVLTLLVFALLVVLVTLNVGGARRSPAVLPAVVVIASAFGAYQYVRNWIELGNPVYPWPVTVGGHTLFEGSLLTLEDLRTAPPGDRSNDWHVAQLLVSSSRFSWGVKYLFLLPLAIWPLAAPGEDALRKRLLIALWLLGLLVFFAPESGSAASIRRRWTEGSLRTLAAPMALATTMAVVAMAKWPWPAGLVPVVPTLAILGDWYCGEFVQPLSLGETILAALGAFAALWGLGRGLWAAGASWVFRGHWRPALLCGVALLLSVVAVRWLERKRLATRHDHYAYSVDYHEVPRDYVPAWKACDEPDRPHVVALVGPRRATGTMSLARAATRWFWYPLLGSRWQNRVVYASIHEPGDMPTRPFFGGLAGDGDERVWFGNLRRLGVDRLVLMRGSQPEERWIEGHPPAFRAIATGDSFTVYHVEHGVIEAALRTQ